MRKVTSLSLCKRTLLCLVTSVVALATNAQTNPCAGVPAVHGNFTIDKRVPTDVPSGTFNSFNDAYNYIKCGIDGPVVFTVAAGTGIYSEQLIMNAVAGTSATNTITFHGNNNMIAFSSSDYNERAVIKLNGTDYTRFDHLSIMPTATSDNEYGYGVHLTNDADNNSFSNCTIDMNMVSTAPNYAGIMIAGGVDVYDIGTAGCDHNEFVNNTITGGYYGIATTSETDAPNTANLFKGNTITDFYNYGIYLGLSSGTIIDSNYISRPARADVADCYGIYTTGSQITGQQSRNRIFDPFGGAPDNTGSFYGFYFDFADMQGETQVVNNLVYNLTGSGNAYGVYDVGANNLSFYHNTFSMDGPAALAAGNAITSGFHLEGFLSSLNIVNNIVTVTRGGAGKKYAIYETVQSAGVIAGYNDYYLSPGTTSAKTGYYGGSELITLTDWQTATNNDGGSVAFNPVYRALAAGDLTPTSAAVDNKGFAVGITTDINGAVRSTTAPDMGAYEFTPAPCTAPPTAGIVTATGAPACAGASVGLSLSGNSTGVTQTYQWAYSTIAAGIYTNLGGALDNTADTMIQAATTLYYRVGVTCGGATAYTTPVLVTVNPALPADVYTIDKTAAPGTFKTFNSFNDAKSALACGITGPVVFNVKPGSGPYDEQLILDSISGTSAVNTITFNGNGNMIRFSSNDADNRAVIKLVKTDYIIFDSLVISTAGAGSYGYGVQLYNGADHNIIRKCTIIAKTIPAPRRQTIGHIGIMVSNAENDPEGYGDGAPSSYNLFDRDSIAGGVYGIAISAGFDVFAVNDSIVNCKIQDFYSKGVHLSYLVGGVVSGNRISRPLITSVGDFAGVYSYSHDNLQVTNNVITDPFKGAPDGYNICEGINLQYTADNTSGINSLVANNLVYLSGTNSDITGISNSGAAHIHYYHNTIAIDNNSTDAAGTIRGIYFDGNAEALECKNNIVSVNSKSTADKVAILIGGSGVAADRNDYYVSPGTTSYVGNYLGTNTKTITDWKAASAQDAASLDFDPAFVDAAAGDFHPGRGQIDNLGLPVGIAKDLAGATRNATTPDPGAYEFAVAPCAGTPVPGTSVITPGTPVCLGTSITLGLTGNSNGGYYLFQWQTATSATGAWTNISGYLSAPVFITEANFSTWFRCKVICGADTTYATPVQQVLNAVMPKGTYTINPALPSNYPPGPGANFRSVSEAAAQLQCGIGGTIIFDIAPGTYDEQVLMHKIPGASDTSRITFRGVAGNPAAVKLQFDASASDNYVLKLDDCSFVTFKNMSITSLAEPNGRAVVFTGMASSDSITDNTITVPVTATGYQDVAGVYAEALAGGNIVIKGNTITGGTYGVYLTGPDAATVTRNDVLDGNTISDIYHAGIYTASTGHLVVANNAIVVKGDVDYQAYGIYTERPDFVMQQIGNTITIENTTSDVRGLGYMFSGLDPQMHLVMNNLVTTAGSNTNVSGMYFNFNNNFKLINNVINIGNTSSKANGMRFSSADKFEIYNNTVQVASAATGENYAFDDYTFGEDQMVVRNNIFSHSGGKVPVFVRQPGNFNSDYNTIYTSGSTLIQDGSSNYSTLKDWQDATTWDLNSIVYKPAFVSAADLHPKADAPEVWAIHGRGVQISGNNLDFNRAARPDTITAGVPDMGAYEFTPTAVPVALTAIPAAPAPNSSQLFMLGTDTVTRIHWGAAVPAAITARRYSGVQPQGLSAGTKYMYFYTAIDAGTGPTPYAIDQYYIDSWQGWIPEQKYIRLGKTDAAGGWTISGRGTVNERNNILMDTDLSTLYQFTGLYDSVARQQEPPVVVSPADTANSGTRFYASYALNDVFTFNLQDMLLYFGALREDADVTLKINGTTWEQTYHVPAGTVISSDFIPKSGYADARLKNLGISERSISIESTKPITVHTYTTHSGGGSMLLPVGTYGYDYQAVCYKQVGDYNVSGSYVNVIAAYDSTAVEITPSVPAMGGYAANVPFTIVLRKGQVFQLIGEHITPNDVRGYDLTGTRIRSVKNVAGKCFPMAVFSGNSGVSVSCKDEFGQQRSFTYQQGLPYTAWGKKYLTVPTSGFDDAARTLRNVYRIVVKDPAVQVKVNGVALNGGQLVNNTYYEIESTTADYIEAGAPVMVAQFMPAMGTCGTIVGDWDGDSEMFFLTPVEQGIKQAVFLRNSEGTGSILTNYLTVVIPDAGLATLKIDGRTNFDQTYAHPNMPGYTVVVKRWDAERIQTVVASDVAFTGVTYGVGNMESYAYNLGITGIRAMITSSAISNVLGAAGNTGSTTCAKAPVRFFFSSSVKPNGIVWKFSEVPGLSPNADSTQNPSVLLDSALVDGRWMYRYTVNQDFRFTTPGKYYVPVIASGTDVSGCDNSLETLVEVTVKATPKADYTITFPGCAKETAVFASQLTTADGATVKQWTWEISNGLKYTTQQFSRAFDTAGLYNVHLQEITTEGCVSDTVQQLNVKPIPEVVLENDTISICQGVTAITFHVKDPVAGVAYNWYATENGVTAAYTGADVTISPVSSAFVYYVEGVASGCATDPRVKAVGIIAPVPGTPVVSVDSAGMNVLRFAWQAVSNATYYEVSIDGGATWIAPSSGATGLTHTVAGLAAGQTVKIMVRAYNDGGCVYKESTKEGTTNSGTLFIPNSFTPNDDQLNDVFLVMGGAGVRQFRLMIFNQWGQKMFETSDPNTGWDGKFKGSKQPSGVYIYVCAATMANGEKVEKKGSVNLIR